MVGSVYVSGHVGEHCIAIMLTLNHHSQDCEVFTFYGFGYWDMSQSIQEWTE